MPDRNPTPKQRFLANKKAVEMHNANFSTDPVQNSINTALLQYQRRLGAMDSTDVVSCSAFYNRLKGAQEFVGILLNLAETPEAPAVERPGTLKQS